MHVIVIGAGVIGAMTAYYLTEAGHDVTIIEKGNQPAQGASGANASQLSYSYLSPMANPDIIKSIPKILLGQDNSIRVHNLFKAETFLWSFNFLNQSRLTNFRKNREGLGQLSIESKRLMEEFVIKHGDEIKFDYAKTGRLVIFDKPEYLKNGTQTTKILNRFGLDQQILNEEEVIKIEPWLESQKGKFCGSFYTKDDATSDCEMFVTKLLTFLEEKRGVEVLFKTKIANFVTKENKIDAIETVRGDVLRANKFILAAGAWSQIIGRKLGLNLGIMPAKGCTIDWKYPQGTYVPKLSISDYRDKIVFAPLKNRLRMSKYMLLGEHNMRKNLRLIEGIVNQAKYIDPSWEIFDYKVHTGLRPMTADSLPVIKQSKFENLIINTGQGMLGWTLAPASAKKCADIINAQT